MKAEFADLVDDFNEESSELLDAMEESLFQIQDNGMNSDNISAIFRAAHTIKGAGGLFELDYLVKFTHVAENLLDEIRNNKILMSEPIVNLYFEVKDHMQTLVDWAVANESDPDDNINQMSDYLVEQLNYYLNGGDPMTSPNSSSQKEEVVSQEPQSEQPQQEIEPIKQVEPDIKDSHPTKDISNIDTNKLNYFSIKLKFINHAQSMGIDPLEFIKILKNMGDVASLTTDLSTIPDLLNYSVDDTYLSFVFDYSSINTKEQIYKIFDVAKDYVDVVITPIVETNKKQDIEQKKIKESAPKAMKGIKIKIGDPIITKVSKSDKTSPVVQKKDNLSKDSTKEEIIKTPKEEPKKINTPSPMPTKPVPSSKSMIDKPPKEKEQHVKTSATLRVEAHKIDTLINLIGEMVIANSNVVQKIVENGSKELIEAVSVVTRMLEELREASMQTRMVPIGETFSRFKRIVRDLSKDLGKEIELEIIGGDTELDKTVIEKISDPLIHLVRNSLDHGIEMPDIREQKGKKSKGKLILKAYHESGSIALQIIDDGKGLDPNVLKAKAIEKGMLSSGTNISDKEALNLIMAAGFSTADTISNISGRGVGMDVVRRNIEELRGTIDLDSTVDKGTIITIKLPLTLAIIDGFLVKIGHTHYVVPLEMIVECIEFTQKQIDEMKDNNYINLRGSLLPLIDLREYFQTGYKSLTQRENIVIVRSGEKSVGLIVNELHGEFQTVIKPMGAVFKNVKGIGGSTILGSGEVAMILDIPILLKSINNFNIKE